MNVADVSGMAVRCEGAKPEGPSGRGDRYQRKRRWPSGTDSRIAGRLGVHTAASSLFPRDLWMPGPRPSLAGERISRSRLMPVTVGLGCWGAIRALAWRRLPPEPACPVPSAFAPWPGGWRPTLPNARSSVGCMPACPGNTSGGQGRRCRHRPPSGQQTSGCHTSSRI